MLTVSEAKPWWKSKTVWAGIGLILLGSLELLPPHPLVTIATGALMIGLRFVTGREILSFWRVGKQHGK